MLAAAGSGQSLGKSDAEMDAILTMPVASIVSTTLMVVRLEGADSCL